jgi:MFS family permease
MFATLRQRNFALLWFGGLISIAGNWMLSVALPIYVYQLTGSILATGVMFMARMVPSLLLGSMAGVFVDRWDRKRTMVICNLLLALGLLPLLAVRSAGDVWIVYIVMAVQATTSMFFAPAEHALLPRLVDEQHLVDANALNSLNNNLARLVGPPLGGLLAVLLGLTSVVLLDAATFLVAAGLIALISASARPLRAEDTSNAPVSLAAVWREWLAGLRLVRRERIITVIFVLMAITSLGEGVMTGVFFAFVADVQGGGAAEIGWLMGAQAVGGLLGGLLVGSVSRRLPLHRMIGLGSIAFGLIDLMIFNYPLLLPGILPGIVLFVLVGIPGVGVMTGINTLLQTAVADEYRGRVFGALNTTSTLLMLIGTALAGALAGRLGIVTLLNIQGGGYVVAGLLALTLLGRPWSVVRSPLQPTTDN